MSETKNIRVDYTKYEVDEVAETIADAIFFPMYIGKVSITVVIFFLILLGFLTYVSTSFFVWSFFFFILSLAITIPSIVLVSAVRLINTINEDINKVFGICVDTTKFIYEDSKLLYQQNKLGLPAAGTFKDVFRGVAIYVIRPSLKKVLTKRIKFMAGPFVFLVDQIFRFVVIRKPPEFNIETEADLSAIGSSGNTIIPMDSKIKKGSSKVTGVTFSIFKFPLYIVLFVYGFVNALVVWLFSIIF